MPFVGVLYFGLFNPFKYSPPPYPVFQVSNTHPHILYLYILWYVILLIIILFSFLSFPGFNRVVPLLQTCSTFEFVYDHACFCVFVYFWICLPHLRENMHLLCFSS
jgi:hypothetical protein